MFFNELGHSAYRQYDNSKKVFVALAAARQDAANFRGGMLVKTSPGGTQRLVRTSAAGAQKVIGLMSADLQVVLDKFRAHKEQARARVAELEAELQQAVRRNRAEFVGHAPPLVIDLLNALADASFAAPFRVVGTHALYAYEAHAAVRLGDDTLATNDVDLAFNMDHALKLVSTLKRMDSSLLGVLQKVDKTFRIREDQKYTATNARGFEVDLLRCMAKPIDDRPFEPSDAEEDFFLTQGRLTEKLLNCEPFSAVVVSTKGTMARMHTIHPQRFVEIKRETAALPDREPGKARRDRAQADVVAAMLAQGLLPPLHSSRAVETDPNLSD